MVLGWGSTYGAIKTAVADLLAQGESVAHIHVNYMHPLPKNLGSLIRNYDKVLMPEMNNGQFIKIIRDKFLVDAQGLNKIKGLPFTATEIKQAVTDILTK